METTTYCVCLLCEKEVATGSLEHRDYHFGDDGFFPIAQHHGKAPWDDTTPMTHWEKMQVNYFEDNWREDDLLLVIGYCETCIKKKFKSVINKHQFIGNVHQKQVKKRIRRKKKKARK